MKVNYKWILKFNEFLAFKASKSITKLNELEGQIRSNLPILFSLPFGYTRMVYIKIGEF